MFAIVITEKGGEQRRISFNKAEITIGRVQGNDIVLPKGNVSKRHARIVLKDGKFIIVDLKSTNGTYVNGRKITSPLVVKEADKIYIGDFIMGVEEDADGGDVIEDENIADEVPATPPPAAPPREAPAPMMREPAPMMREPAPAPMMREPAPAPMMREPAPMPRPEVAGGAASPELLRAALGRQEPPRALDAERAPPRPSPAPLGPPAPAPRPRGAPGTLPPPVGGLGVPPGPLPAPGPLPSPPPMMAPAPLQPLAPAPIAPAPAPTTVAPPGPPPPMPMPAHLAPSPAPAPAPAPPPGTPTLVPGVVQASDVRQAVAAHAPLRPRAEAARPIAARPVGVTRRRGVTLEPLDPRALKLLELQARVLEELRARLGLDQIPPDAFADEDLWRRAERTTAELVDGLAASGELPRAIEPGTLVKETLNEALGLGPLEDLLADEQVDEIRVERRDRIAVGKDGAWRGTGKAFTSDDAMYRVLARLLAPIGRRLDETGPLVDLRLRDGSRLTAAMPPAAPLGPTLALRKPRRLRRTLPDLVAGGTLSDAMASFLQVCIAARRNLLVCGGPGVGKTAVLAALAAASPAGERVVSIEDLAEVALDRDEWVALETTPAGDLGALLRMGLRLAPDRLVVGDIRGTEAFPLAAALAGSVEGAVVAVGGDGTQAALARWAALARVADGATADAVRELIASAVDVVVHVGRLADGTSRVLAIDEIRGQGAGGFDAQTLFGYRRDTGFAATGATPAFWPELGALGIDADPSLFG